MEIDGVAVLCAAALKFHCQFRNPPPRVPGLVPIMGQVLWGEVLATPTLQCRLGGWGPGAVVLEDTEMGGDSDERHILALVTRTHIERGAAAVGSTYTITKSL